MILDGKEGKFKDNTSSKTIDIKETINLNDYAPTKEGYTFAGWYDENDTEFKDTVITVDNTHEDIRLHAKWIPSKGSIKLDLNYDDLSTTLNDIEYGSEKVDLSTLTDKLTRTGYVLDGFYFEETLILDKDGKVVDKELFNSLILKQNQDETAIPTFRANWLEGYVLTINVGTDSYSINCAKNSTVKVIANNNQTITVESTFDDETITTKIPYSKIFFGLYENDTQIVGESGGSITMSENKTLSLRQGNRVTFKTKDGSVTIGSQDYIDGQGSYTPTLKDAYSIVGWYDSDGNQVLNSDGSIVDGVNLDNEVTVYARFKTSGYVVSSTMDSGKTYVITSGTRIMTGSGSSISSTDLSTTSDTSSNSYIPKSSIDNSALWTYDGSTLMNNSTNTYLSARRYWNYILELSNNSNISDWEYSGNKLFRSAYSGLAKYYVYLDGNDFDCDTSGSNIILYTLSDEIITDNYN